MKAPESPPPRLVEDSGPVADWLRHALAEERSEPLVPRFSELKRRRARRMRTRLAAGAALVAATALGAWCFAPGRGEQAPLARAEPLGAPLSLEPRVTEARSTEVTSEEGSLERSATRATRAPSSTDRNNARRSARASTPTRADGTKPSSQHTNDEKPPPRLEPVRTARDCAALARDAAAEEAMRCYEELASGSGVTAELALFEQARLAGKVLRQPARALVTLDDYQRRFPRGSLRAEVQLARIDWLLALGDKLAAGAAVQDALDSGLLREREAELLRLRDSLPLPNAPAHSQGAPITP